MATDNFDNGHKYAHLMRELKMRLRMLETDLSEGPLAATFLNDEVKRLEFVSLQLRKVLELLVFASLTAHQERLSQVKPDLSVFWRAKTLLAWLEKQNPFFFPRPINLTRAEGPAIHFDSRVGDDIFTIAEFGALFDACSEVLHIANPFAPVEPIDFGRTFTEWIARIRALLDEHMIFLSPGEVFMVNMLDWTIPDVQVFRAIAE